MERYLFLLGRTPDLSVRELICCGFTAGTQLNSTLFEVSAEDEGAVIAKFNQLGGSTKLVRIVGEFGELNTEQLTEYVTAYFAQFERPTFALGEINRDSLQRINVGSIKQGLKERNISSRFIEGNREGLSAAVLSHKHVEELLVIRISDEKIIFGKTLAVQDIDEWTHRDREKPYADRKKGMLPPKVGRMMVNIGIGEAQKISQTAPRIYDPFCGTGTILMEAMEMGYEVIGSDVDMKAVAGASANLTWFAEEDELTAEFAVFQSDATRVTLDQLEEPVELLVTEPFLGKQTPNATLLPNIFRGMEKLYLGAFRQWRHILTENAVVVIIFPVAQAGKIRFSLESIIDKLATLGYTSTSDPSLYARPQAAIQRQIWTFQFKRQ